MSEELPEVQSKPHRYRRLAQFFAHGVPRRDTNALFAPVNGVAPENERATLGKSNSLSLSPRGNLSWQRGRRMEGVMEGAFEVLI